MDQTETGGSPVTDSASAFKIIDRIKAMAGNPELSDQEFRVWTVAALSAGETGVLWKAIETIAAEAAAATRTTERALSRLVAKGHLKRSRRGRGSALTILPWAQEWPNPPKVADQLAPVNPPIQDSDPPKMAGGDPPKMANEKKSEKTLRKENQIQRRSAETDQAAGNPSKPSPELLKTITEYFGETMIGGKPADAGIVRKVAIALGNIGAMPAFKEKVRDWAGSNSANTWGIIPCLAADARLIWESQTGAAEKMPSAPAEPLPSAPRAPSRMDDSHKRPANAPEGPETQSAGIVPARHARTPGLRTTGAADWSNWPWWQKVCEGAALK